MLVARSELSYYPEESYEIKKAKVKSIRDISKTTKKNVKSKRKDNSFLKLVYLLIPMILMVISIFVLVKYANITSVRSDITKMEREMIELERNRLDLVAELEGIKSSVRISEEAMYKLGMDYPSEDQIVYISVSEPIVEHARKDTIGGQLKKVFSMVTNLF